MKKGWMFPVCLVAFYLLFGPVGCSMVEREEESGLKKTGGIPNEAEKPGNLTPLEADSAKRGEALYVKHCLSCHGASAKGDGPRADRISNRASNLLRSIADKPEEELAWIIASGFGHMPAWKHVLSERDIRDVLNYIKMLEQSSR